MMFLEELCEYLASSGVLNVFRVNPQIVISEIGYVEHMHELESRGLRWWVTNAQRAIVHHQIKLDALYNRCRP
jgi:hypothetical protein